MFNAIASGFGSIIRGIGTRRTNKTNLKIARETNEANERMNEANNKANREIAQMNNEYNQKMLGRQIQQQWDMWNAENEYNDPAAQMARMSGAGINPYMAVGNISPGNASSMTAPPPASADTSGTQNATQYDMPAPMQAPDFSGIAQLATLAEGIQQFKGLKESVKSQELDNESKTIENKYLEETRVAELSSLKKKLGLIDSEKANKDLQNDLLTIQKNYQGRLYQTELDNRNMDYIIKSFQANTQMYQALSAKAWYQVLPQQIQATLATQLAELRLKREQGNLTSAQVDTEVGKLMQQNLEYFHELQTMSNEEEQHNQTIQIGNQVYENNKTMFELNNEKIKWEIIKMVNNSGYQGPSRFIQGPSWNTYHYLFGPGSKDYVTEEGKKVLNVY